MIQGTQDTRYAYVNGIIRSREARLLTKAHLDRLIAADLASFGPILADTPYAGPLELPDCLQREETSVRRFFDRFCVTDEVRNFVEWPEQIHNLKVRLKEGSEELLYEGGIGAIDSWPEVVEAVARYAVGKDPFLLSTDLDRILCHRLHEAAAFEPFFQEYFTTYFDLENIRSLFRARQFEDRRGIYERAYIPLGRLRFGMMVANLDAAPDQMARSFFNTPYGAIVDKGGAYFEENNSFLRLERLCEERRLGYLQQARRMTFGVEPLFAYYMFKKSEITKLRQVYWGRLNDVASRNLKESIPDVW